MHWKTIVKGAALLLALVGTSTALAEPCPAPSSDDGPLRRALAREWFARAEDSETSGERDAAVKQYACSLRLIPHPSTAYNLALAAEKSGDPSMAADAYRAYLRLMPDAPDRAPTEIRIAKLEGHVAEVRKWFDEPAPLRHAPRTRAALAAPRPGLDRDPDLLPPLHLPDATAGERRIPPWPVIGGAAAAAGTGLLFNLVARSKMTSCRDPQLRATNIQAANEACSSARPYAYGSYALLGLGAALGTTGAILIFRDSGPDGAAVNIVPSGNGATVGISGGF